MRFIALLATLLLAACATKPVDPKHLNEVLAQQVPVKTTAAAPAQPARAI